MLRGQLSDPSKPQLVFLQDLLAHLASLLFDYVAVKAYLWTDLTDTWVKGRRSER